MSAGRREAGMVGRHSLSGESAMRAVLQAYPNAVRTLMRRYRIGGCSSCAFHPDEPLRQVLARHEAPPAEEVIEELARADERESSLQISPLELAKALQSPRPPRLIDVREPEEIRIARLDGAVRATYELLDEMRAGWPAETPIVAYCHHGIRSLDFATLLLDQGFTNVRSLTGGIDAWAVQVDPSMPRY